MNLRFLVLFRVLLLVGMALAYALPAAAQSDGGVLTKQQAVVEDIAEKTDTYAKQLDGDISEDGRLVEIRNELEKLSRALLESGLAFRPRLMEINARLDQLGPPRAEGEPPEPTAVAEERGRLLDEKARINAIIGEAESLSLQVNRLIDQIAEMRRDLFAETLSKRYDMATALNASVVSEFRAEVGKIYYVFSSWLSFVFQFKLRSLLLATFFAALAAAVLYIGGRKVFGEYITAKPDDEAPSYLSRLSVAFCSTLIPSTALGVFFGATYFFYNYFGVLTPDIAQVLKAFFGVAIIVFFVFRLAWAALSPWLANWRLAPITTRAAHMLFWLIVATATVTGLDFFISAINEVFVSPLSLTIAKSLIATVIVGFLVILIGRVKPFADEEGRPRPWPAPFRYLLFLLGAVTIVASVLGYIGLARFLAQQIVVTGAIVATMYVGFLTAGALSAEGAFAQSALGRRLSNRFGAEESTLDQFGLVAGIVSNILIVICGIPLVLLQWGFHWGDITSWTYGIAREIKVGSFSFSIIGILTGIIVFIIGFFVTRWFQRWIDGSVMARGRVDSGVRNSIRTAVGYAGVAIAGLIGISAAGIDLSSLALVAGALSLGIGFGLQNIVSNFVSGLILLAERPFKAGDWIVAGAVTGTVKKISVRATEIETFQRQTVILPNSELINAAVGNWTHKNKLGRLEIRVEVAYGSDVRRVHEILLDIAQNHPLVLKNPEPFVLFSDLGEYAYIFEIRVFLADILTQLDVQNDIRFAVVEAFAREGIEIPFPQRDIHMRSGSMMEAVDEVHPAKPRVIKAKTTETRKRPAAE